MFDDRFEDRMYSNDAISRNTYNMIMGGTVLYGLIMNVILCIAFPDISSFVDTVPFVIGYFIIGFAGIAITYNSDNPIISFIGYNLVAVPVGLVASSVLQEYGLASRIVIEAFTYTAVITFTMVIAASIKPEWFSGLGTILFICLTGLLISGVVGIFFNFDMTVQSWVGAIVFSLYIGYDFYRSQQFPATVDNAVDCALDLYLDIINLLLRIIRILGKSSSSSKSSKF